MEKRPRSIRHVFAVPALVLLAVGLFAVSSGGVGSSSAARGRAAESVARGAATAARPAVEADVTGALEAEGVGAGMAECAGRRVGTAATPGQLARASRQPAYAWRWAWKAADACRNIFMSPNGPYA
jgi:hypothetical protein